MEVITKITAEAVKRYFNALFKFGYKNYRDTEKVLLLIYLEELLSDNFFGYVTEDDFRIIKRAFNSLIGSNCMIEYPSHATYDKLFKTESTEITPRLDGNDIFRVSDNSLFRIKM
jgi:hypothetical protein